jgi:nicotinate-nucleotide adenylyltransferase
MRRIGVFGGTFDPPHLGHLTLAEWAREALSLDRVIFVPAAVPPHKRRRRLTAAADRVAMTRLAVRGHPAFTVSTLEVRRTGPSYTVDTLRALARVHPRAEFWLLMGEDSLREFHTWHAPREILALASLAVAGRPGVRSPAPAPRAPRGRVTWLRNPRLEISSSAIRRRVRAGRSVRYWVPDGVARYLAARRLYAGGR